MLQNDTSAPRPIRKEVASNESVKMHIRDEVVLIRSQNIVTKKSNEIISGISATVTIPPFDSRILLIILPNQLLSLDELFLCLIL
jgi:hypothetical protein